jgi:DNA polymerase I-like protein with 3'-5' exonuclease and polymerase domains
MAGVVAWQRSSVARAMQPPYEVRDFLLGRRRTFPLGQVEATEAMNSEVQPSAAAIMNTGMARMDEALEASRLKEVDPIAQIHDACVFECWEDDAPKVGEMITQNYTQEYERDGRVIPFPVEVRIGMGWDEL